MMTSEAPKDQVEVEAGTDDKLEVNSGDETPESRKKMKKKKRRPKSNVDVETIRVYLSSVLQRLADRVSLDTLRPLPMFLGISGHPFCLSAGAFTPPMQTEDKTALETIRTRIALNGAFFLTNYALVALGVAVVIALLHPGMLLVLGIVWSLWWFHEYLINHEVRIGNHNLGTMLSITQRSNILTLVTVLAVVWACLAPVIVFVIVSGIIILLHAIMRDPQHLEESQFANASTDDEVVLERGDVI